MRSDDSHRMDRRERLERGLRLGRRAFLRAASGAVAWLASRPLGASPVERAPEIHRATRNTTRGAIGVRWPRLTRPPKPWKEYAEAPRTRLPRAGRSPSLPLADVVRDFAEAPRFGDAPLTLAELTRVLHFANGVTLEGEPRLRAAPSAGALYAGEVYVLAERVSDLPPGAYYYDVLRHALVRLRAGSSARVVGDALEEPEKLSGAAAVVLLTNVFGRYTWRYANRGYRYALIDSGHIGENLRLAARSAGLVEGSALRFRDDLLNAQIEIDGRTEAVCALHALGRPTSGLERTTAAPAPRFVEAQQANLALPGGERGVIERYHEATKLVPGSPATTPDDRAAARAPVFAARVALGEKRGGPTRSLEACILARRSVDRFDPAPLTLAGLRFIVEIAQGHAALDRADGVDLYLAVHRVEGLDPGLYRYERPAHALGILRGGDLREALVEACLGQRKAGSAAVGFMMVARLRPSGSALGDRRYRDRLLEAGAVGERIYLAAEALGFGARNLAAFRDDPLNELVGLDPRREGVIHLTMAGPEV